jgi:hypothetical protein
VQNEVDTHERHQSGTHNGRRTEADCRLRVWFRATQTDLTAPLPLGLRARQGEGSRSRGAERSFKTSQASRQWGNSRLTLPYVPMYVHALPWFMYVTYLGQKTRSLNNRPTTFIMSARVWTLIWTAKQFRRRPNLLPPGARTNYHVRVKISKWSPDKRHVDMRILAEFLHHHFKFRISLSKPSGAH